MKINDIERKDKDCRSFVLLCDCQVAMVTFGNKIVWTMKKGDEMLYNRVHEVNGSFILLHSRIKGCTNRAMKEIIFVLEWQEVNWACQPIGRMMRIEGEAWSIYRAGVHLNGKISRKDGLPFDMNEFMFCCCDDEQREHLAKHGKAVPIRESK